MLGITRLEKDIIRERILNGEWDLFLNDTQFISLSENTRYYLFKQIISELLLEKNPSSANYLFNGYVAHILPIKYVSEIRSLFVKYTTDGKIDLDLVSTRTKLVEVFMNEYDIELTKVPQTKAPFHNYFSKDNDLVNYLYKAILYDDKISNKNNIMQEKKNITQNANNKLFKLNSNDDVTCIELNQLAGEVLIGTTKGNLISYDMRENSSSSFNVSIDSDILCLRYSSDKKIFAVGESKGKISIIKRDNCKTLRTFSYSNKQITHISITKDNSIVVSTSSDNIILGIGLKSGSIIFQISSLSTIPTFIVSVCFNKIKDKLLFLEQSGKLSIYNTQDRTDTQCNINLKCIEASYLSDSQIIILTNSELIIFNPITRTKSFVYNIISDDTKEDWISLGDIYIEHQDEKENEFAIVSVVTETQKLLIFKLQLTNGFQTKEIFQSQYNQEIIELIYNKEEIIIVLKSHIEVLSIS